MKVFQNYSQTYAAAITAFVGMATAILPFFGVSIESAQLQFVVGSVVNFAGIVWVIVQRARKGDVSVLGVRQ